MPVEVGVSVSPMGILTFQNAHIFFIKKNCDTRQVPCLVCNALRPRGSIPEIMGPWPMARCFIKTPQPLGITLHT
jgi:hypothetical protein